MRELSFQLQESPVEPAADAGAVPAVADGGGAAAGAVPGAAVAEVAVAEAAVAEEVAAAVALAGTGSVLTGLGAELPSEAGTVASIEPLLPGLHAGLRRMLRRFRVPPHEAEDILQEGVCCLLRQWQQVANPSGYLYETVRRQAVLHGRRAALERRRRVAGEELAALTVESPAGPLERRRDGRYLLSRLPETVRRIARLHHGEGLPHREIARRLGLSESAVRQLLSRGLRRLQREMRRAGHGAE
jgi:RNA polymerase sigma factor (sigma-70 family)